MPEDDQELPQPPTAEKKEYYSVEDLAHQVLAGHWSRGHRRNKRLEEAGYDPAAVNEEVTRLINR